MLKPYYERGGVTIYHGDCREVLPGLVADVVVTDPPYDQTPLAVLPTLLKHRTAAIFGYPELLVGWCVALAAVPDEWVVWSITNPFVNGSALLPRTSEHIAIFGVVWTGAAPGRGFYSRNRLHPNEKPLPIMRRLVELCSDPGQVLLDPFMGSGTTL